MSKQAPVTATVAAQWFVAAATNCTAIAEALVAAAAPTKTHKEREGCVESGYAMLMDHILPMLANGEGWLLAKLEALRAAKTAPVVVAKPAPVVKPAPAPVVVAAKTAPVPVAAAPAAKPRVSKAQWQADRAAGLAHHGLLKDQCVAAGLPKAGKVVDLLARLAAAGITPVARPAAKQVDAKPAPVVAAKPVAKKFTPLAPTPAAVAAAKAVTAKPATPAVAAKTAPATCQAAKGLAAMAVMLGVSLADLQAAAQLTNVTLTVG